MQDHVVKKKGSCQENTTELCTPREYQAQYQKKQLNIAAASRISSVGVRARHQEILLI